MEAMRMETEVGFSLIAASLLFLTAYSQTIVLIATEVDFIFYLNLIVK